MGSWGDHNHSQVPPGPYLMLDAYRTQSLKGVDGWSLKTMQGSMSNDYVHLFYEEFYNLFFLDSEMCVET